LRLLPHTAPDQPRDSIAAALAMAALPPDAEIAVFIGPEGGFAPAEVALAQAAGCHAVTLGPLTLRSETAALAALALLAEPPALL
jgi:16S rRNA (uracil1498-N3)-methyltransferase